MLGGTVSSLTTRVTNMLVRMHIIMHHTVRQTARVSVCKLAIRINAKVLLGVAFHDIFSLP